VQVKLKTYFQCLSSLNFPEWYLNQPVAGDGDDEHRGQLETEVTVEMSCRSVAAPAEE